MARPKRCEEEFSPWPSFVDLFSSVILVLLLFIMVIMVSVAYYKQFNSKSASTATTTAQTSAASRAQNAGFSEMVTLKKEIKVATAAGESKSDFDGGASAGHALGLINDDSKVTQEAKEISKSEMVVAFHSKDIFIDFKTQTKIYSFIKEAQKNNPNAKIEISTANTTQIPSATIAKQISVGRALHVKNLLKKQDIKLENITFNIKNVSDEGYKDGFIKLNIAP